VYRIGQKQVLSSALKEVEQQQQTFLQQEHVHKLLQAMQLQEEQENQ
jgi:hypothetical protein